MLEAALLCLAMNVYYESRGEPIEGQIAVAQVTVRRALYQQRFVCREVYRPYQFSWTHQLVAPVMKRTKYWTDALFVAKRVMRLAIMCTDNQIDYSNGATHFHTRQVNPWWAHKLEQRTIIGNHIFYVEYDKRFGNVTPPPYAANPRLTIECDKTILRELRDMSREDSIKTCAVFEFSTRPNGVWVIRNKYLGYRWRF